MSSGVTSYFGFEYQFYISVWLMLLSHKKHDSNFVQISIETLFGQDAEIVLGEVQADEVPDSHEETLFLTQEVSEQSIQVQVKTRVRTRQWSPGDIRHVLLKADESRATSERLTVLERLVKFPNEIFVFITNGKVATSLTNLLSSIPKAICTNEFQQEFSDEIVENIKNTLTRGESDDARKKLLEAHLTPNVIKRIHVFEAPDFNDLKLNIETILEREYRILPYTKAKSVSIHLLERVRRAALSEGGNVSKEDLTAIVGHTLPKLPYPEVEAIFQETQTYSRAKQVLDRKHIVILVGEPGVGKTTIGQKLVNELYSDGYTWDVLNDETYREIYNACKNMVPTVILMDDPFGDAVFDSNIGLGFTNSFSDIARHLQNVNGSVKLVLTTRGNVLSEVMETTKITSYNLREYRVNFSEPSVNLQQGVLKAFLNHLQCSSEKTTSILSALNWQPSPFEDLLHVRDFAQRVSEIPEITESPHELLEASRPSEYERWIRSQPPKIQLFLLVLWLNTQVSHVTEMLILQQVYEDLAAHSDISRVLDYDSSGFHFYSALETLRNQDRIKNISKEGYDFFHPKLKAAVRKYFEHRSEFVDLSLVVIRTFGSVSNPLKQSIAAMLVTVYYDLLGKPLEMLKKFCRSRFLDVRETVIRLGAHLISHSDAAVRQYLTAFYRKRYIPGYNCELDENGYLVVSNNDVTSYQPAYFYSRLYVDTDREINKPENVLLFKQVISGDKAILSLNAFERYWFVHWLTQNGRLAIPDDMAIHFLERLAIDHISFVRYTVAARLGHPNLIEMEELGFAFRTLCYDNSPHVKIDILEHAILPNWANLSESRQQEILTLVVDMLDDPVFRRRVARGLVDQSGTLYFYHKEHTEQQKQQWFEAVAFKLLEQGFGFSDDFDRFLAAFVEHMDSFSISFRVSFLQDAIEFLDKNPFHAADIVYTVRQLVFSSKTSQEEHNLILDLMKRLPAYAKAELIFDFAKIYRNLPDDRYRQFVHRPFYTESPKEFVLEQTASLLGFLDNPNVTVADLPESIATHGDDKESAIWKYIETQSDDYKLILVFHVFDYAEFTQTEASSSNLHAHPIIEKIIEGYLHKTPGSRESILVTDTLLRSGYSRAKYGSKENEIREDQWNRYLDIILTSKNSILGKAVCDILFASNVASAVHKYRDWLLILRRLITHSSIEIREYATALFDNHFHKIWKDLFCIHDDEEVISAWLSEDALKEFLQESELFSVACKLLVVMQRWQSFSEHQRQEHLDNIEDLALSSDFQLKWLLFKFVERMNHRLTDSQSAKLYRAIFDNSDDYQEQNILGREEQLDKDFSLKDQLPQFDWAQYI